MLVNAAGPYVSRFLTDVLGDAGTRHVRLVKGSHIVVPRLYAHDRCYIFQNADGRVCFAIPYQDDFTLIGTTDEDFHGDPADGVEHAGRGGVSVPRGQCLSAPAGRSGGYRMAIRGGASAAGRWRQQGAGRDARLRAGTECACRLPPVLSVFGGKLTTYRRLAEAAMAKLAPVLSGDAWRLDRSRRAAGRGFPVGRSCRRCRMISDGAIRFSPKRRRGDWCAAYGTLANDMLGDAGVTADLGRCFGADLTEREVDWLVRTEWARTAEDVLWRRSKLGMRIGCDRDAASAGRRT